MVPQSLESCSLDSGLRSLSPALERDNAWWENGESMASAVPYRKALAVEEIRAIQGIEGMPADSRAIPSPRVRP